MKVNKRSLKHWSFLLVGGANVVAAVIVRKLSRRNTADVVFYGHTFNGNLKALAEHIVDRGEFRPCFATLDPQYFKALESDPAVPGEPLSLLSLRDTIRVARSAAVVTDRKAHVLELLNRWSSLPFVDVWHGVPFKGFTPGAFAYLENYQEVWVSSEAMKGVYAAQWQVTRPHLHATGYSRTDRLVAGRYDAQAIRAKYGISDRFSKIVLVAPTWKQDDQGRSIVPFGATDVQFFEEMDAVGAATGALFIFRAHLNVADADAWPPLDNVVSMPYADYPDAEEFLSIADVLVTDWSSIAFDYLALRRPTIFLDVPPPFKDGLTLGLEHRFGDLVASLDEFTTALRACLDDPDAFVKRRGGAMDMTTEVVFGATLDGESAARQYSRLKGLVG